MADAQDLKSCGGLPPCGFDPRLGYLPYHDLRGLPHERHPCLRLLRHAIANFWPLACKANSPMSRPDRRRCFLDALADIARRGTMGGL